MDWSTLTVEAGSFIDADLRHRESDLLYRVALQNDPAFLYLLFEHQRQEDPLLAFRLLCYLTRIWEKFLREHPGATRLPPVIPVVLAQNARPWELSTQFQDLVDIPSEQRKVLAPLTPAFDFRLIQLASLPFDKIVGTSRGILTLRVLKAEQIQQLLAGVVWDEVHLQQLSPEALNSLLRYIYHAANVDKAAFLAKLKSLESTTLQENTMTLAEQFRQEGRQEGRQKGQEEGRLRWRRQAIAKVLELRHKRVPAGLLEAIEEVSADNDLDRLLAAAATCETLEEFSESL